jgi:hypothetical protein
MLILKKNFMTFLTISYKIIILKILNKISKEYKKLAKSYTQMVELMPWKTSSIQLSLE